MAFGPIMKLKTTTGLALELAPFSREDLSSTLEGMQKDSVLRFISLQHKAQTIDSIQQWYDGIASDSSRMLWGIWAKEKGTRKLIGNTVLMEKSSEPIVQMVSGIVIADNAYWGKGIASACHKARTWYAFRQLGLVRIKSAVIDENHASRLALEKVGYSFVYTERNDKFVDGKFRHKDCFECLNPDDWAWRLWWGDDRPTRRAIEARDHTRSVLEWAENNVELA